MTEFAPYIEFLRSGHYAVTWAIAASLALMAAKPIVIRRLKKLAGRTNTHLDDAVVTVLQSTRVGLLSVAILSVSVQSWDLSVGIEKLVKDAGIVAIFIQIGLWLSAGLSFWLAESRSHALKTDASSATSLSAIGFIGRVLIWIIVVLSALDNMGINITSLVASLGIGGVAVALAVQNILGDLFASLSIVADKPFVIGDFIVIDDYMGTVEHVGLKTTRIRSLGGEQIIFSNGDLLKNRVRNYKRMFERRVVFGLGVLYQTPRDALEKIPGILREIVQQQDKVRFDRAHCLRFGESSIDFEVVYWVLDPDYNRYMDIQQAINFQIMRRFDEEGVDFAFPTRTVVLEGTGKDAPPVLPSMAKAAA